MLGVIPSGEFNKQLVETVKTVMHQLNGGGGSTASRQGGKGDRTYWAICNSNISAPANGVTAPTSGGIEFLVVNSSGNMERTGDTDTLTHRWEGVDLVENMLIRVVADSNEWICVAADCGALGSPPV